MFCALNGATATPRRVQPAADAGDEHALAGVGGGAGDQQRSPHGAQYRRRRGQAAGRAPTVDACGSCCSPAGWR